MNVKLVVGIALFIIGLATAVAGIAGVGDTTGQAVIVGENQNTPALQQALRNAIVPAVAGLALGVGGLLIGLSMGNWKHPRTHLEPGDEIVDPEGYHKMKHV